jgi:predicted secreted hydrolase
MSADTVSGSVSLRAAQPALLLSAVLALCSHAHAQEVDHTPTLFNLLGTDGHDAATDAGGGYATADEPREFVFPLDHGAHPEYHNEWWYFTGNLATADGRRFGYQWVLFRAALTPQPVERSSRWGADQAYMSHFAVTDAAGKRFRFFERYARGAAGLAGVQTEPLRLWLEDWSLEEQAGAGGWRLQASADEVGLELELQALKPVVLQGERGLSRKSAAPGNASYYYSISRLASRGILRLAGQTHDVSGYSWLDREWGTSALAEDQQGWDWFALQLDDDTDFMFYLLRRKDGTVDPFSRGVLIDRVGQTTALGLEDIELAVLDHWRSPRGVRYPARWRLSVASHDVVLDIRPLIPDQELDATVRYWEGAVEVAGSVKKRPVTGRGYVELVGYEIEQSEKMKE